MRDKQASIQTAHAVSNEVDLSAGHSPRDDVAQRLGSLLDRRTGWDLSDEHFDAGFFQSFSDAAPVVHLQHWEPLRSHLDLAFQQQRPSEGLKNTPVTVAHLLEAEQAMTKDTASPVLKSASMCRRRDEPWEISQGQFRCLVRILEHVPVSCNLICLVK